jgi:hypothetical protein
MKLAQKNRTLLIQEKLKLADPNIFTFPLVFYPTQFRKDQIQILADGIALFQPPLTASPNRGYNRNTPSIA